MAAQLNDDQRVALVALTKEPLTYMELSFRHLPCENGRRADRALQALRRKGLASFIRDGRRVRWSATAAGRELLAEPGATP